MENLGEVYFNLGIKSFEAECYEAAVDWLIRAYKCGYESMRILEIIYASFVLPNEQEFRKSYDLSCEGLTQLPYEACMLDFIPVSENRFYIFDKGRQEFFGVFELKEKPTERIEEEFGSILYTDTWDVREMLPNLREKKWSTVYVLLGDTEPRFMSFLKLPGFKELYLDNVAVFKDINIMYAFFSECAEYYLPKNIVSSEPEKYAAIIQKLHVKRISDMETDRKNIYLSICIPSYNRGTLALKNVRHLLRCPYDSEIEIIVSNNGSTKDVEGYGEIQRIKDSRVRYHEFEENQGHASNVLKCLELAKGSYVVLTSDEDLMFLDRMGEYLSCLKANSSCGVLRTSGKGNFMRLSEDKFHKAGSSAISWAANMNYMTGITYCTALVRDLGVFKVIEAMRGNHFVEHYLHAAVAMAIGVYTDICDKKIELWDGEKPEETDNCVLPYMLPESRIAQQRGILEFCHKGIYFEPLDFCDFFLERVQKTYFLLELAYKLRFEDYKKRYAWKDICYMVHKENMDYLEMFPYQLQGGNGKLRKILEEIFIKYLNSKEIRRMCEQQQ